LPQLQLGFQALAWELPYTMNATIPKEKKKKKKKNSSSNKPFLKELHSVLLSTMGVVCLKRDEKGEGWCLLLRKCFQTVAYMLYITLSADLVQVLLNSKGSHDS